MLTAKRRASTAAYELAHREERLAYHAAYDASHPRDRSAYDALRNTPERVSWIAMRQRCRDSNVVNFPRYGGRGIAVCDRWQNSFEAFLEDMGERPPGMTLDRIDNDGNYEPGNCRWATYTEQRLNQRGKS